MKKSTTSKTQIETLKIDLTDYNKVSLEIKKLSDSGKNLDIVIFNAGIAAGQLFKDLTFQQYQKTIDVNFLSNVHLTKQIMENNQNKENSHKPKNLIYISSIAGYWQSPKASEYCPSKHAIRSFVECYSHECDYEGLKTKFSVICPYFARTWLTESKITESQWKVIPFLITAKDVAATVFDVIYYDIDNIIVGWVAYIIKWRYLLQGDKYSRRPCLTWF